MNIKEQILEKYFNEKLKLLEILIEKVDELKFKKKITYAKLAELIDIDKSDLINFVNGNRLPSTIKLKILIEKIKKIG